MKIGELKIKWYNSSFSPLFKRLDCINRIEVIPEQNAQTKEIQLYKHAKVKPLVQLEMPDGEVLTIPLDRLYKAEMSKGKTTIHCKSYEEDNSVS